MFQKILIANRGEIALRILRAANDLNIRTVAIFAAGEENAPHVTMAGEAVSLGDGLLNDTYLNIEKIVAAAINTGSEAIHPGYGFLSENHLFARACEDAGIRFMGPSSEVLRLMGNKLEAKTLAERLLIPVLWNMTVTPETVTQLAASLSFPVLIKSAHGGGGKGMQVAGSAIELEDKVATSSRMALRYFGNGEVYIEPYLEDARHIEVQVLGDDHGNLVHLYERDCTLQRNYQKIIEEAPAPNLDPNLRLALLEAAMTLCGHVNYSGAGTVEFLVDAHNRFYFMEMNPRLQVEHPGSEEITGTDIVKEQLRIAAGEPLSFSQDEVSISGHAIETRIYSEDPRNNFSPSTTPVSFFRLPSGNGIRVESALSEEDTQTTSQFDPLLCKIIAHGNTRSQAFAMMENALRETIICGPATNQTFLLSLLKHPDVGEAMVNTRFCETRLDEILESVRMEHQKVPETWMIAAFLFLKFLPHNRILDNPWLRMGTWNMLNQLDIKLGDQHNDVRFKLLRKSPELFGAGSASLAAGPIIQHFSFAWNTDEMEATARITSANSIQVFIGKNLTEIFYSENQSGQTVFYWHGFEYPISSRDLPEFYPKPGHTAESGGDNRNHEIVSPLHGKVIAIPVREGQEVSKGELVVVIESMKSENHITAHRSGVINSIKVEAGMQVTDRMPLMNLE